MEVGTSEKHILLYNFGKRKSVYFTESLLPESFIGTLGVFFDRFMRIYAKVFFPFIICIFVINEIVSKAWMLNFVLYYCCFLFTIVIIAYYFHCRLRDFIGDDLNKWIAINMTNGVDRRVDIISTIALDSLRIPPQFTTDPPNADRFLKGIQETPFMHNLTWTIMDHKFIRFSWIRVDKSDHKHFLESLEIGDGIFYHSNKSVIGCLIRFISRCYWEHSAVYIGNGEVQETVPPDGMRRTKIIEWLQDDDIELSVLRQPIKAEHNPFHDEIFCKYMDKWMRMDRGYSYYGVFKEFWVAITNKKGDGFMKLHIFLANIILISTVLWTCYCIPELTRVHLFLIMIFMHYIVDTIYHWWAYKKRFDGLETFKLFERHVK